MRLTVTGCAVLFAAAALAQSAPYAGQQDREIKALGAADEAALLAGAGMGLAKAAELNSYPGPMHALELAAPLGLDPAQREQLHRLMDAHKARARTLGAEVVELERALDRLFAERRAADAEVEALTARIGAAQGRLRAEHLKTHLATARLLAPPQIARYDELRGYRPPNGASKATPPAAHGAHSRH